MTIIAYSSDGSTFYGQEDVGLSDLGLINGSRFWSIWDVVAADFTPTIGDYEFGQFRIAFRIFINFANLPANASTFTSTVDRFQLGVIGYFRRGAMVKEEFLNYASWVTGRLGFAGAFSDSTYPSLINDLPSQGTIEEVPNTAEFFFPEVTLCDSVAIFSPFGEDAGGVNLHCEYIAEVDFDEPFYPGFYAEV